MERRIDFKRSGEIDTVLRRAIRPDGPGLAIAVIKDGAVAHLAGYGLANLDTRAAVNPQTIFHMASCAKPITGIGIVILKEAGGLGYDDHIGRHIPELAVFPPGVTIRRLLHHLAGVLEYYDDEEARSVMWQLSDHPGNADVVRLYQRLRNRMSGTAGRFAYCNAGYDLLGCVIERISGQSYRQFFQERVFAPLGMRDTFSLPESRRLSERNCAVPYTYDNGGFTQNEIDPLDGLCGSASIYSTVADLCGFDAALAAHTLISPAGMREVLTSGVDDHGNPTGYGFGWGVQDGVAEHSGSYSGFESYIRRDQDGGLSVYVLSNGGRADDAEAAVRTAAATYA